VIELAGQLFGGNSHQINEVIRPDSAVSFLALANYFKKRNDVAEAMEMLRAAGSAGEQARRQYVGELITAKDFGNAYALWSPAHPGNKPGVLVDPGFEQEQALDEGGFGWRTDSKAPAVSLSLDPANPKDGRSSLRVDFNGDSDPGAAIISQLVLVEPGRHYRFHFAYRTDALVTGGPPQLLILDAKDNRVLGQSAGWPENSDGWRDQTIELVAGESTDALLIAVQRDRCPKSPCPIFGRLWLDNFALEKE
ncbi:MAG: hypothetical protein QOK48_1785, partial [Blastocatellia bacterium]|nr:hypothetical protein [Blastocatellia bacterium]